MPLASFFLPGVTDRFWSFFAEVVLRADKPSCDFSFMCAATFAFKLILTGLHFSMSSWRVNCFFLDHERGLVLDFLVLWGY